MIIIGEKVNATRKRVKHALEQRDQEWLRDLVTVQTEAGARYIDLNVGTGSGSAAEEIEAMRWLIDLALDATDKPLCIDSADPKVLEAAAAHLAGKRDWMLNSIKGEQQALDEILPLVAEHGVPFVALAMDEDGIARDVETRLQVCHKIFAAAEARGIEGGKIFFDPLVMPVVTDISQGRVTCECLRAIDQQLPDCKTVLGLSNVSHGLPARKQLNQGFLISALMFGLDAAILDPTDSAIRAGVAIGEALAGKDRNCRRYARAYRQGLLGEPKK